MQIIEQPLAMQQWSLEKKNAGQRVTFVPTMGNLHRGHLSLVEQARQLGDVVVVSIFVNPLQFGPNEDFDKYPRTFDADREKLAGLGVEAIFLPHTEAMYPAGKERSAQVYIPELSNILCGEHRPGHFQGVTTVVAKLFNIVQPDVAVFGEKDFQQLFLIRQMAKDLFMPIEIVGVATLREADGLAMSSRNGYLGVEERKMAPKLYEILRRIKDRMETSNVSGDSLCREAMAELESHGFSPEYVELRSAKNLQAIEGKVEKELVVLAAARLGTTRLIDNLLISLK